MASLLFSPCSSCSSLVPGAWCLGHSAVRRDLVCCFFFSFAFFRSSFWWRGSASFVNTLPAVVSTRWWFPFVAFVCGCSQNMCMSSDVSVTKRQLVAAAKKTAYRGTGGVRRVLVSARMEKSIQAGGEDRSAQEEDTLNLSSRRHTQNDKNLAITKQATSPQLFFFFPTQMRASQ